ncbi:MAG: hypothetical protein ABSE48_00620 [Verrucomicrobiota bacterium]
MKWNLQIRVWAMLLLCGAGIMTARAASSTFVTFSVDMATNIANGTFNPPPGGSDVVSVFGTFNGYASPGLVLVQEGSSTIFTNSYNDTTDANGTTVAYRFMINGNLESLSCYDNRADYLPATSGASLVLPTPFYGGDGPVVAINVKFQVDMSEELELGNFKPALGNTLVIAGSFNSWSTTAGSQYVLTNDPSIIVTNNNFNPPIIESNVYTATVPVTTCANTGTGSGGLAVTNEIQEWKYVEMPEAAWEAPGPANDDHSGNRFFLDNTNQTLPLVSFSDELYSPLATVNLKVDMSGVAAYDTNFEPNTITAWGTFNGWASGVQLTNNLAASNTNLYSATVSMGEGTSYVLQFRYTNSFLGGWVYDYAQDGGPNSANNNNYRHLIDLPVTSTLLVTNLSYYFNDLAPDDYLPAATAVTFSVDMNGAIGTDSHAFVPGFDSVYINGMFAGATPSDPTGGVPQSWYPWSGGVNPVPAPPGFQMIEEGSSTIYTNTIVLPAGTPVALSYQYGMDIASANGGPVEDEAAVQVVHYRAVRSTGFNSYQFPTDTFTNQPYVEPFFSTGNIGANGNLAGGQLTVGTLAGGKIPVSWLGRPGARLQVSTNLASPVWQSISATDGTNWTAGYNSANGLVSVTNWPTLGSANFRLVKP